MNQQVIKHATTVLIVLGVVAWVVVGSGCGGVPVLPGLGTVKPLVVSTVESRENQYDPLPDGSSPKEKKPLPDQSPIIEITCSPVVMPTTVMPTTVMPTAVSTIATPTQSGSNLPPIPPLPSTILGPDPGVIVEEILTQVPDPYPIVEEIPNPLPPVRIPRFP